MAANSSVRGSKSLVLIASGTALLMAMSPAQVRAGNGGVDREKNEITIEARPSADQALARFTVHVSDLARKGLLDPFVGERQQVRKILEVMNKRGTKVVYVLGEAGTGKTAMIEHASGMLEGIEMYRLNTNSLEAGTGYRGMLEDRVEAILEAFIGHPDRILFIDEAHVAMKIPDFMDKLKPAMARGEISVVLATTEKEFTQFIEPDVALTSRASVYRLENPTEAKLLNVLRANQARLSEAHGIAITESAMQMTARLTMRHYSNEPVMRKALDLVDRAAVRMKLSQRLGSMEVLALEDSKEAIELQLRSVESDIRLFPEDQDLRQRRVALIAEITKVNQDIEAEGAAKQVVHLEMELDKLKKQQDTLARAGKLLEAAKLKNEDIPKMQKAIRAAGITMVEGKNTMILTDDQIVKFVGKETGIPDDLLAENDVQKLQRLRNNLNAKVLGQPQAIDEVMKKVKIRMAGIEPVTGPQAVILMDGPTGVGKSEMMKAIALSIFGSDKRMVRVNVNSLGSHFHSQLYGAGPGLVNSDQGGKFDEVRKRPYSLVGLDEFDKAATTEFYTSLLQILDEGVVKDAMGRTLDFRNTILVMQSNFTGDYAVYKKIWSRDEIERRYEMEPGSLEGLSEAEMDSRVLDAAMDMKGIPPEVRNRIGVKLVFNALDVEKATAIAAKNLDEQRTYIWQEKGVQVDFDSSVAAALAMSSFDPIYGARPVLQKRSDVVSDLLADLVVSQGLKKGDKVRIHFEMKVNSTQGTLQALINDKRAQSCEMVLKTNFDPRPKPALRRVQTPFDFAEPKAKPNSKSFKAKQPSQTKPQPKVTR